MRLSTLGLQVESDLVTPHHEKWLKANHDQVTYSDSALKFAASQLSYEGRLRTGSFSASSLGSCERQQMLTFLGYTKTPLRARQIQVAHNGNMMHLRWQMAGLTAGWLAEPEVAIPQNAYGLRGTMDGVLSAGQGLELKSCNANAFSGVKTFGIKEEHDFQVHTYMLATGIETFAVIYENKDTQDWYEIVRHRDPKMIEKVKRRAEDLMDHVEDETMPEMISKCIDKEGWQYDWCEYRHVCPAAKFHD